jgi:hypothetical protein
MLLRLTKIYGDSAMHAYDFVFSPAPASCASCLLLQHTFSKEIIESYYVFNRRKGKKEDKYAASPLEAHTDHNIFLVLC